VAHVIHQIVTPRWLVWSVEQSNAKTIVLSAQLSSVTIQDYAQTPFAEMILDSEIQVTGLFTDAGEGASAFIGLEKSGAGSRFREIVIQAAQEAKKKKQALNRAPVHLYCFSCYRIHAQSIQKPIITNPIMNLNPNAQPQPIM
jgi:hypothetical protein